MTLRHAQPVRGLLSAARSPLFQGRFGRMFRNLPPASFGHDEAEAIRNLGRLGERMVAAREDPPVKDGPDGEEGGVPALYTYLGQFIDHDLTFDPASSLQQQNDPNGLTDFRTPGFDLDCVYGRGKDDQPYMYDDAGAFLLGASLKNGAPDLPRAANRRAIIGDPRNDENSIVSQLQALLLRFHNRKLKESGLPFAEVQQLVRFHYQYVVLHDFLPRIVHHRVLDSLKTNGQYDRHKLEFFRWRNDPFLPVEFSAATYRFGHSMVRPDYRLNDDVARETFPNLVGFQGLDPTFGIDWGRFIDVDTRPYGSDDPKDRNNLKRLQFAYRIDTSLGNPLGRLPPIIAQDPGNLAQRNLLRGWRLGLPSGQSVARAMGLEPLRDPEILIGKAEDHPGEPLKSIVDDGGGVFADNCPLWTYVLAEAMRHKERVRIPVKEEVHINTPRLGPVGGRIVAEVFLGLMFGDGSSLLRLDPRWTPGVADYRLKDFVKYALGK